uniref:Uncharacterized protein n=1 Tax=viral metagenome TaxID=1070528 RepID=A0A6C0E1R5_9ZZZZ
MSSNYYLKPDSDLFDAYFEDNLQSMNNIPDINYAEEVTSLNEEFKKFIDNLDNNHYSSILPSLKLTLPSLQEQYNRKTELSVKLKVLEEKYRFLSDYIDMVHDFRVCFNYFKDLVDTNYITQLITLIQEICSFNMNINPQKSYKVHLNIFRRYINDLKQMGFAIPELPETQIITEENITSLNNIKTFYRESGRGLDSFYQKTGQHVGMPVPLVTNAVGTIDGCRTKCDASAMTEKLVWKQNVAGIFEVTLSTNVCGKGCHEIKVTNATANIKLPFLVVFNIKGEVVLDDVLDYLPYTISSKALRNTNHDSTRNSIRLVNATIGKTLYSTNQIHDINFNKSGSKYMNNILRLCFMVLKTVCDKTVVQRIKNPKEVINAVCTGDSYVFAVPLIEYLSGNIRYCPSVLISKEYGYDQFSFQDVGNNNELLNHIIYFISFSNSTLFKGNINVMKQMPIFASVLDDTTIHEMANRINKLIFFTDKYIDNAKKKVADFSCDNLWVYLKTVAIAECYDEWYRKKQLISEKLNRVVELLISYNGSNEDMKVQLINAFLDIPIIIPSITGLIIELENQADVFVPVSIDKMESYIYDKLYDKLLVSNLKQMGMNSKSIKHFLDNYLTIIHNCQINTTNCDQQGIHIIKQTNVEASEILDNAKTSNSVNALIQKYKIKINPLDIYDILNISSIRIEDDYVRININKTNPNYESILNRFVKEYNEINETQMAIGQEDKDEYILLPINAELLINISKQYYSVTSSGNKRVRSDVASNLYKKASSKLFDIIKDMVHLNITKKTAFQDFFLKTLQNGNDCNLEQLWKSYQLNDYFVDITERQVFKTKLPSALLPKNTNHISDFTSTREHPAKRVRRSGGQNNKKTLKRPLLKHRKTKKKLLKKRIILLK